MEEDGDGDGAKARMRIVTHSSSPEVLLTNSSFLSGSRCGILRRKNEQRKNGGHGFMKSVTRFLSRHLKNTNEYVDPVLVVPGRNPVSYSEILRGRKCISCNGKGELSMNLKDHNTVQDLSFRKNASGLEYHKDVSSGGEEHSIVDSRKVETVTAGVARTQMVRLDGLLDVEQDTSFFDTQAKSGSQALSLKQSNQVAAGNDNKSLGKQKSGIDEQKKENEPQMELLKHQQRSNEAQKMGNNAVAGALAGVFVSLCLHPLDTVKTVIQSRNTVGQSLLPTVASIISARGVSGLYRGLPSNLASSAPISAIYAFTYESVKAALLPHLPEEYYPLAHCAAGGCASVATSLVYTPSERVKQQMQIGAVYRNSWFAFVGILQRGGLPALYAGWEAVLCRNVPQSVIKFFTYEGLKHFALKGCPPDTHLTNLQTLAIGGLAGSTAALFTTPFDVVKTRLQTQTIGSPHQYTNVLNALHRIAADEGIRSLYRGLIPRLAIYVSQGALFFASYEFFKRSLAVHTPVPEVQKEACCKSNLTPLCSI